MMLSVIIQGNVAMITLGNSDARRISQDVHSVCSAVDLLTMSITLFRCVMVD